LWTSWTRNTIKCIWIKKWTIRWTDRYGVILFAGVCSCIEYLVIVTFLTHIIKGIIKWRINWTNYRTTAGCFNLTHVSCCVIGTARWTSYASLCLRIKYTARWTSYAGLSLSIKYTARWTALAWCGCWWPISQRRTYNTLTYIWIKIRISLTINAGLDKCWEVLTSRTRLTDIGGRIKKEAGW
jgi:hypothetical protein